MKKILLVNDDGVQSYGLLSSKEAVENLGEVVVVAPAEQQSGKSRSISFFKPLKVSSTVLNDDSKAFSVNGTPADCVGIGIFAILNKKPDLLISGINIGPNLGISHLTASGTVGGALEGASYGIPSISISLGVNCKGIWFLDKAEGIDFSFAKNILNRIAKNVLKKGMPKGVDVFNINVPANPVNDEIVVTRLGKQLYYPEIEKNNENEGEFYIWKDGNYENIEKELGSDRYTTIIENRVTVTPLTLDLTVKTDIKNWLI
jgi:5'-nucleotidase